MMRKRESGKRYHRGSQQPCGSVRWLGITKHHQNSLHPGKLRDLLPRRSVPYVQYVQYYRSLTRCVSSVSVVHSHKSELGNLTPRTSHPFLGESKASVRSRSHPYVGLEHQYRNGLTRCVGPEHQYHKYRKGVTLCETGATVSPRSHPSVGERGLVCLVSSNNPSHQKANSLSADYKKWRQEHDQRPTHGPPETQRLKVRTSDTPDINANTASHTDTRQAPVPSPALLTSPASTSSPTNTKDAGTDTHLSYPPVPLHIPQTLPWKQTTTLAGNAVGMPNIPSPPRQVEDNTRQHKP